MIYTAEVSMLLIKRVEIPLRKADATPMTQNNAGKIFKLPHKILKSFFREPLSRRYIFIELTVNGNRDQGCEDNDSEY